MEDHENTEEMIEKEWEFWKTIVLNGKGEVDLEQLKKELYDYSRLIEATSKVYSHVTGGMVSKPNTCASEVMMVADEYTQRCVEDSLKDVKVELDEILEATQKRITEVINFYM